MIGGHLLYFISFNGSSFYKDLVVWRNAEWSEVFRLANVSTLDEEPCFKLVPQITDNNVNTATVNKQQIIQYCA